MANYVLDKGYVLSNGGAAQSIYRFMELVDQNSVKQQDTAGALSVGVVQQRVDAEHSATGNVQVDVRILGITKVEASAAIALMAEVTSAADGRAVTAATAQRVLGVALSPAAGAGEWIDVLLVPAGRAA